MEGNNEIRFNQASMRQVVEYYLNTVLLQNEEWSVSDVSELNNSGQSEFKVIFNRRELKDD